MDRLLTNALLVDIDPPGARHGWIRICGDTISETGTGTPPPAAADGEITDCGGAIVIPGLVVGHTHLYSALAPGMPPPKQAPGDFVGILEQIWWKLDRALDDDAVEVSALAGAARAALCGATTIVDHHASPNAIPGSLDRVRAGIESVGLRGILCYEVTDRNGAAGAKAGLEENDRYLSLPRGNRFCGLVGAHASFTLGDDTLGTLAEIADAHACGIHIHAAEDPADERDCIARAGCGLVERFGRFGILRPGSIVAHGTHLDATSLERLRAAGVWMAHNPRSNMNNSVGYAPVDEMAKGLVALGTDGIDGDIFTESRFAFFKARDARAALGMADCLNWVAGSARMASDLLGVRLGRIEAGGAADLAVLRYDAGTPVSSDNLLGHWFFGFGARHVTSVMACGEWVVRDGELVRAGARRALERVGPAARRVWRRFCEL